jgi:hypothetical protein
MSMAVQKDAIKQEKREKDLKKQKQEEMYKYYTNQVQIKKELETQAIQNLRAKEVHNNLLT